MMATKEQKQELIDKLRFTPCTYTVGIYGYGGEIAMGRVKPETVEYFKRNLIGVEQYATTWSSPGDDDYIDVPEDLQPFPPGSWYDGDNIEHCSGAEFGGCSIQVHDQDGNVVWERDLGHNVEDDGCQVECWCEEIIDEHVTADSAVFVGQSFEKGTFFDGELELKEPFDPSKFKFTYSEIAGWPILNTVEYDGEELDGSSGYGTTGKSSSFTFYYGDEDGVIQEYDTPSSEELGVPAQGPSPSDWEQTPRFTFAEHQPVHVGWYQASWGDGNIFGTLYWTGNQFVEYTEDGSCYPVESVVWWTGYNWDTSSWANQPPEPPQILCDCEWTGQWSQLNPADEGPDHCPNCGSTEWNWIDYDAQSPEGLANREKYCVPAQAPAVAVEQPWIDMSTPPTEPGQYEIKNTHTPVWPFPATFESTWTGQAWIDSSGDPVENVIEWRKLAEDSTQLVVIECECVQCSWRGPIDDTDDNDGEMCCPECGEPVELD